MRVSLRVGTVAAALAVCAGLGPTSAMAQPECRPALAPADEAALTGMINAERRAEGVRTMVTRADLRQAGRVKSLAMARGAKFGHSDTPIWARGAGGAQNIAMAPTAAVAFQAMLASPGHRKNLMAKDLRLGGVGAARDCGGMVFFTINLRVPPPS